MKSDIKELIGSNSKEEILRCLDRILKDEFIESLEFYDNVLVHAANLTDLSNKYMVRYKKPFDESKVVDLCKRGFIDINYIELDGDFVVFNLNLTENSIKVIEKLLVCQC